MRHVVAPLASSETTLTMNATATVSSFGSLTDRLLNLKGNFVGVSWNRPMKTRKGITDVVTKSVRTTVQVGVNYENREVVKEARADGTAPSENAGLPWGAWEVFPYVIAHNGKFYVRLYPVRNADGSPRSCKVVYKVNGETADRKTVESLCPSSEFSSGSPTECYTLAIDNLRAVRLASRSDAKKNYLGVA